MAEKSYGFAIGNLRARENTLLRDSDFAQLTSLKSTSELAHALADRGMGERGTEDVSAILESSLNALWIYLEDIIPDRSVLAPFIAENDFHNFKAVLKGVIKSLDYSDFLMRPNNIPVEVMENAVKQKRFDMLPEYMREGAARAYELLISTGDSQLADGVLDAACMRTQLDMVGEKGFKSAYTAELVRTSVFFANTKSAIRAAKAGKGAAFLDTTLVDTGYIGAQRIKKAALGGVEDLLDILPLAGNIGRGAAEAYRISPDEFERYCDNFIMSVAKKARFITMGAEPAVGYMMARLYELKNLRIVYSGIKTGQSQEKTLGKLRELYG